MPSTSIPTTTPSNQSNGTLSSANAGSQSVTTSITLSNAANGPGLASNYTLQQPTLPNVTISQATVNVIGETVLSKPYDGTTTATLTGGSLSGLVPSDASTLTFNQAGNFTSASAGTAIPVVASDSLSGASAGNYNLVQPTGLSADIIAPSTFVQTTPVLSISSQNYIIGLNSSVVSLTPGTTNNTGPGGNGTGTTGTSNTGTNNTGSNNTGTNNTGTTNSGGTNNGTANKLYCN